MLAAGDDILLGSALPIRAVPHIEAGLGRDDQLIPVRLEILGKEFTKILFSTSVWRAIVVGKVKMCDSKIERLPENSPGNVQVVRISEIVSEPQGYCRKLQSTGATAIICNAFITVGRRLV